MVRALPICSLYNIASLGRLCSAISENLAYRWFCFLTIDDPVFDHSSISHVIDRIGREGFGQIFDGLNQELLRLGLLSPEMYVDSSLVKAKVSGYDLAPSGLTVAEFKEQAIEVNGLFQITQTTVDDDGVRARGDTALPEPRGQDAAEPSGHRRPLAHRRDREGVGTAVPGERHRRPGRVHPVPRGNPRLRT